MTADRSARSLRAALAALALSAVSLTIAPPALAQLSPGGGPIAYSADNLEYFDAERKLVLTGNVEVAQSTATLRADRLTLFFAASATPATQNAGFGASDIDRIFAEGNVFYIRPEQTARGNQAVYEARTDSVTFTGSVVVASEENVIRGETLVLEVGGKRTTVRPGKPGERVRGVFRTRGASATP